MANEKLDKMVEFEFEAVKREKVKVQIPASAWDTRYLYCSEVFHKLEDRAVASLKQLSGYEGYEVQCPVVVRDLEDGSVYDYYQLTSEIDL